MEILIIDGSSVFEIDEECMKKNKIPKTWEMERYIHYLTDKTEEIQEDR